MSKREVIRVSAYLPPAAKAWVEEQADRNYTSITAEITRAILERRDRMEAEQRRAVG
jgi:hypothetical protein